MSASPLQPREDSESLLRTEGTKQESCLTPAHKRVSLEFASPTKTGQPFSRPKSCSAMCTGVMAEFTLGVEF